MKPTYRLLLALAVICVSGLGSGCAATSGKLGSLNLFKDSSARKTASSKSGFGKNQAGRKKKFTDSPAVAGEVPEETPRDEAVASAETDHGLHDAASWAAIEEKTRDFPPVERERALAVLKTVPAEDVDLILGTWRASLARSTTAASPGFTAPPGTLPNASAPGPVSPPGVNPNGYMLGQQSPWPAEPAAQNKSQVSSTFQFGMGAQASMPDGWGSGRTAQYPPPFPGSPAANSSTDSVSQYRLPNSAGLSTAQYPVPQGFTGPRGGQPSAAGVMSAGWTSSMPTERRVVQPPEWNVPGTAPRFAAPNNITLAGGSAPAIAPETAVTNAAVTDAAAIAPAAAPQINPAQPPAGAGGSGIRIIPGRPTRSSSPVEQQIYPGQRLHAMEVAALPGNAPAPLWTGDLSPLPPPATDPVDNWQNLIAQSEADVAQLVPGSTDAEQHEFIRRHATLRMLYLMQGQTERALQPIPNVSPVDQEFWTQLLWGLHNYLDSEQVPLAADRAAQAVQQMNTALLRLDERVPLALKNVNFCNKINSFGDYNKYPRDEFAPGQQVLLYSEIEHFHSELTQDGKFRTLLKSTLQIYHPGPTGALVEELKFPGTEDLCLRQRRDYYHSYLVDIPSRIAAGPYVLKLVVEDELGHKVTTQTVPFTVK